MEVTKAVREFKYNGVKLVDPDPSYSLEQVREFYSTLYPEIINAEIEGPESVGNKTIYEFRRAVGTKGAGEIREFLEAAAKGNEPMPSALSYRFDLDAQQPLARVVAAAIVHERREGVLLPAPSEFLAPLP